MCDGLNVQAMMTVTRVEIKMPTTATPTKKAVALTANPLKVRNISTDAWSLTRSKQ
jgi:hypothetical protein